MSSLQSNLICIALVFLVKICTMKDGTNYKRMTRPYEGSNKSKRKISHSECYKDRISKGQ